MPKESAQLLESRLRENNLLARKTAFFWYRNRDDEFRKYFARDESTGLCTAIMLEGLKKLWA